MKSSSDQSELPYHDSKPQGSADFYFAINATFRFLIQNKGLETWRRYIEDMALSYYRPVWQRWKKGGVDTVANYLKQAFAAEPEAVVEIIKSKEVVVLEVKECPAIKHLRKHGRDIVPEYCQHCYFQGEAMSRAAGMTMRLEGGNGHCKQRFYASESNVPPQDLNIIERAS